MNLGWGELALIAVVVLLLFGARRLPDVGRSIGEAIREFQRSLRGDSKNDSQPKEKP